MCWPPPGCSTTTGPTRTEDYFAGKTDWLPATMKSQLQVWLDVMAGGSRDARRRLPRDPATRKLLFADPIRGLRATPVNATVPRPLDTHAIRDALDSPDPAVALAVALVAFHALTRKQLSELKVTDVLDGRLRLGKRTIRLAAPVRIRLTAWLDHRTRTWPGSVNPHLFVSRKTAPRRLPVGKQFP